MKLFVSGQNLDVVQKPIMKSVYNSSSLEFISVSRRDIEIQKNKMNYLFL